MKPCRTWDRRFQQNAKNLQKQAESGLFMQALKVVYWGEEAVCELESEGTWATTANPK